MPKSIDKYTDERNIVLQKLFSILEITDINKKFSLKELDQNEIKKNAIINLELEIKKYFLCSRWTYFSNKKREFKRNYLSLIKALVKTMNIKMITSTLVKKNDDNTSNSETFYIFEI